MEKNEAINEAINILMQNHQEEFNRIYKRKLREVEKYGGILK